MWVTLTTQIAHQVEVVQDEHQGGPTTILREGSIFGEVSLVCNVPRRVTVRARTHVDLLTLSKIDLDQALHHYPTLQEEIHNIAVKRFGPTLTQHSGFF